MRVIEQYRANQKYAVDKAFKEGILSYIEGMLVSKHSPLDNNHINDFVSFAKYGLPERALHYYLTGEIIVGSYIEFWKLRYE